MLDSHWVPLPQYFLNSSLSSILFDFYIWHEIPRAKEILLTMERCGGVQPSLTRCMCTLIRDFDLISVFFICCRNLCEELRAILSCPKQPNLASGIYSAKISWNYLNLTWKVQEVNPAGRNETYPVSIFAWLVPHILPSSPENLSWPAMRFHASTLRRRSGRVNNVLG